ncbi:MAG TPA: CpaF family protein [Candidatus Wallbacteria bacterium]|nr:CpaF family protein [Candidatus Wallbacteria bacterium]
MSLLKRISTDDKDDLEKGKSSSKGGDEKECPSDVIKTEMQNKLVEKLDEDFLKIKSDDEKKAKLKPTLEEYYIQIAAEKGFSLTSAEKNAVITSVINDVIGLGPMQPLLEDVDISEVMINGPYQVYIEKKGKLILSDCKFKDNAHVMRIIEKIVAPLGRRCDESSPIVDARIKGGPADGSRVNAIIPPLALNGPTVTIRKFKKDAMTIENLINFGAMTREMATFLEACVLARLNIVVSGGTGSGKTTLLNILSCFIPEDERIVTIEDAAELQLKQPHVVRLETRPANIEGKGAITIRDLVKNSLRMRPERVVIGECRGGEALDMLQAMNTGHDGSLTTGHANTPRDMIARLETMVMMSGMDLPVKAIREQIAGAVNVIVQQSRLKDGSRKVTAVTEVQGMEGETVVLQDVFVFEQHGIDEKGKIVGRLKPTGIRPKFMTKFEEQGIKLPADLFVDSKRGW